MYDFSNWGSSPGGNPLSLDGLNTQALAGYGGGFGGASASPLTGYAMPDTSSWAGAPTASGGTGGFMDFLHGAIGTKEAPGWGGLAVGGAGALMNGWMGMKQYGLAKQALAENKRQFQMNYDAQKTTTNTQLEDRQRARVAANPGAYESVGNYMNQNGIK